jgi:hypothetical protein
MVDLFGQVGEAGGHPHPAIRDLPGAAQSGGGDGTDVNWDLGVRRGKGVGRGKIEEPALMCDRPRPPELAQNIDHFNRARNAAAPFHAELLRHAGQFDHLFWLGIMDVQPVFY